MENILPVKKSKPGILLDKNNVVVNERIGDGLAVSQEAEYG
jgi:hypothetical protein